jgi:hypothetical protein
MFYKKIKKYKANKIKPTKTLKSKDIEIPKPKKNIQKNKESN